MGVWEGEDPPGTFLAEQREDRLRDLVGLGEDGGTGLLQDLRAGHVGHFRRVVGVLDARTRGRQVGGGGAEVGDGRLEAVLVGAEVGAQAIDLLEGVVQGGQRIERGGAGGGGRQGVAVGRIDVDGEGGTAGAALDRAGGGVNVVGAGGRAGLDGDGAAAGTGDLAGHFAGGDRLQRAGRAGGVRAAGGRGPDGGAAEGDGAAGGDLAQHVVGGRGLVAVDVEVAQAQRRGVDLLQVQVDLLAVVGANRSEERRVGK